MKGDLYYYDSAENFKSLKPGSVIKLIECKEKYNELKKYENCLVMRLNSEHEIDSYYGVTIYHPDQIDLGGCWYIDPINEFQWEIIKER